MLEKTLEQKLKKGVKANAPGALCLKFVSPGFLGVPDRIILLPGAHVVFVEMKAPGKSERTRQLFVQGLLRRLGFPVFSAVNSEEKVAEVIRYCKRWEVFRPRILGEWTHSKGGDDV